MLDDIITQLDTRMGDASVEFKGGLVERRRNNQQRVIILQRTSGVLRQSTSRERRPKTGANAGTRQRYERYESILVTIRAETEVALDTLFDNFVNAVFEEFGPNVLADESAYEWVYDDSRGGANSTRNPAITLTMNIRIRSRSQQNYQLQTVASATSDVSIAGATVTVDNP